MRPAVAAGTRGISGRDNRRFVEAVLWLVRTGAPLRDLPKAFGRWNSVFRRCSRGGRKGVWLRIFAAMSDDPDFASSWSSTPPLSALTITPPGAKKGGRRSAIGRSRGGLSTNIDMVVLGLGCQGRLALAAGQKGDGPLAEALLGDLPAEVVMADAAYGSDALRAATAEKGAEAVVQHNPSRAQRYPADSDPYAMRSLVEGCFSRLKQFRRAATRYEKTESTFLAVAIIAAIVLRIR